MNSVVGCKACPKKDLPHTIITVHKKGHSKLESKIYTLYGTENPECKNNLI